MKTIISSIVTMILVLFLPLFLAVQFASASAGMAVCLLLFYVVNPVFSVVLGIYSGLNIKKLCYMPSFFSFLYILSVYIVLDTKDSAFLFYAGAYFLFGTTAMLFTFLIKHKEK